MNDPLTVYESLHHVFERVQADRAEAWKLALLIAVTVGVAWRIFFAWLQESISGAEALILTLALLLAEGAAVRWLRDFEGVRFLLVLAIPLTMWLAAHIVARISASESRRGTLQADIRRFRAAIRRDPKNAAAHELLGDAYLKVNQPRRALAVYRSATTLDPGDYRTRYKLQRATRLASAA